MESAADGQGCGDRAAGGWGNTLAAFALARWKRPAIHRLQAVRDYIDGERDVVARAARYIHGGVASIAAPPATYKDAPSRAGTREAAAVLRGATAVFASDKRKCKVRR